MEASTAVGPGNDELLAQQGVEIPGPDEAQAVSPDVVTAPPAKPDITKAQLVGLVPVVAKLGIAFGLFKLTGEQQEALTLALGGGAALFIADAAIRFGRSIGFGKR